MYQQIDVTQAAIVPTTKEEHEILEKYHRTILEHQELRVRDKNIIIKEAAGKLQKYNTKWTKKDVSIYFKNLEKKKKSKLISSFQYPQQDNAQGASNPAQMPQVPRQPPIPNPFQSAQNFVSPQNSQMQTQMQAPPQAQQKSPGKKGKNKGEEPPKVNMNPNQFYPQQNMANGDKSNQKVMMNQFQQQFAQPMKNVPQMPNAQMGQMPQFNPQFQAFQATQVNKKTKKSKEDKLLTPNQMPMNAQPPQGQVQMQKPNNNPFQMNNPAQQVVLNGPPQPAQTGKRKSKKEEKALAKQATMMNQQMYQFNQQQMQPMMAPNMAAGSKMGFGAPMQPSQQQMPLNKTPSQMMQMQPGLMQQTPQQLVQYPTNGIMQKVPSQTFMNIPQQPQTPSKRSPKSKRGQAQEAQAQEVQQDSLILPPEAKLAQITESPKKQKQKKQAVINTEKETKQRTRGRKPKAIESNDDDDDDDNDE